MAAPLGAVVLALVEGKVRDDVPWFFVPPDTDGDAVRRAADAVRTWSFGSLVELAVYASYMQVGPWISSQAPATAATAYRHVEERLPIAEAVDEVFGPALHQPVDVAVQEWWNSAAEADGASRGPPLRRVRVGVRRRTVHVGRAVDRDPPACGGAGRAGCGLGARAGGR